MPLITGPLKWYTLAETIRQAVHAGLSVPVSRSGVVPGAIAWDECDCGLLAVSVNRIFISEQFPNPLTAALGVRCDASYEVAEIVIQVIRCAPGPGGADSFAPTVAQLDASAQAILRDAYDMLLATSVKLCQMEDAGEIFDFLMQPLTAQGPSGQCVGNELRLFASLGRN